MDILHNPNLYKVLLFSFIGFSALGLFLYTLNDMELTFKRRKYKATLKQAIALERLTNDDIYPLATRWLVKKEQITATLNLILSDYLNDKDCSDNKLNRIRELIVWHQKNDPFSDLPDDIKLQLQRIQKIAGDDQEDILRLSKSLSDIYLSNQRQVKREWYISRLSLFFGALGFLCGLYGFFK